MSDRAVQSFCHSDPVKAPPLQVLGSLPPPSYEGDGDEGAHRHARQERYRKENQCEETGGLLQEKVFEQPLSSLWAAFEEPAAPRYTEQRFSIIW